MIIQKDDNNWIINGSNNSIDEVINDIVSSNILNIY